jgi:succinylglutamate desuccinylase
MGTVMLNELTQLPDGLLDRESNELLDLLPSPTLIHLEGERSEPLFVSVLQHGNEDTGWVAIRELLREYENKTLPRALSLFISNVEAAQYRVRRLEHQIDYNRIWPGCDSTGTDEHRLMRQVWEIMRERKPFASIDIHNNTGHNPHYACVNKLDNRFFNLAELFSETVVYFIKPNGVQSLAFAQFCPAVTVECGKPGEGDGVKHAKRFVETVLNLDEISDQKDHGDMMLFHTVAIVRIPEHLTIGFDDTSRNIDFVGNLDQLNFIELPPGTLLANIRTGEHSVIEAWSESGQEVANEYFAVENGQLVTRKQLMPSMLTRDVKVIRQDCLCYLMERMDLSEVAL